MPFNDLQNFVTLAEKLNFTRAAQGLFITQSSLSKSISRLEDSLGFALFDRDSHSVELTPAGKSFYKDTVELLDMYEQSVERARVRSLARNTTVKIGGHLANTKIYAIIESARGRLRKLDEPIDIEVDPRHVGSIQRRPGLSDPIEDAIAGANDVNILYTSARMKAMGFMAVPLYEEEVMVHVSERSPLAQRDHVSLRDLEKYVAVTTTTYYSFSWAIAELYSEQGIKFASKQRVVDSMGDLYQDRSSKEIIFTAKSMLSLVPPQSESGLVGVACDDVRVSVSAAYVPERKGPSTERCIEVLREVAQSWKQD